MPDHLCPLCTSATSPFFKDTFLECRRCRGLSRPRAHWPTIEQEKLRYEEHHNDVHDNGYQRFVSPISNRILTDHTPEERGLDFGSGTGPVISKVLQDADYKIEQYDPIFKPDASLLTSRYDYIVCCEVIEHFHDPAKEFQLLKTLLKNGGSLYCMTLLFHDGIDFANWHYQRDPTHVFIYRADTLEWVRAHYNFSTMSIEDRLIVLGE